MSIRVFLSSTFSDLKDERLEILHIFRRLRVVDGIDVDLITMEDFGFSPLDAKRLSLNKLNDCHAYLGLLSRRYGEIPPGEKFSYSHLEYRQAVRKGVPIFLMERTGSVQHSQIETDPPKLLLLNSWHLEARQKHTVTQFDSISDLKAHLLQHIRAQLVSIFPLNCFIDGGTSYSLVKYFQMTDLTKPFISAKPRAKSIDILAVSALSLFHTFSNAVEEFLDRGTNIRLIILQEGGQAVKLVETLGGRRAVNQSINATKERVRRLTENAKKRGARGNLEIREIDWVFSATLFIFDSYSVDSICWVGTYTPDFATSSNKKWFAELSTNSHADALKFYTDQFNQLWQRAAPVI